MGIKKLMFLGGKADLFSIKRHPKKGKNQSEKNKTLLVLKTCYDWWAEVFP